MEKKWYVDKYRNRIFPIVASDTYGDWCQFGNPYYNPDYDPYYDPAPEYFQIKKSDLFDTKREALVFLSNTIKRDIQRLQTDSERIKQELDKDALQKTYPNYEP